MADSAEQARAALEFYISMANLTSIYWSAYLVVAAAVAGYTIAAKTRPSIRLRSVLTIAFMLFSVANLTALVNKHSLQLAAAEEVIVAVRAANIAKPDEQQWPQSKEMRDKVKARCSGLLDMFGAMDCLHASTAEQAFWLHITLDAVVLIAIWHDIHRRTRHKSSKP